MRNTVISLGLFVLLVSTLGLIVPSSSSLQFMFPRDAVCIAMITLVLLLLALILPAQPLSQSALIGLRVIAGILLAITALRLVLPSSLSIAGVISHTDLFAIAPAGLAYAAAGIGDEPPVHR